MIIVISVVSVVNKRSLFVDSVIYSIILCIFLSIKGNKIIFLVGSIKLGWIKKLKLLN